MPFFIVHKLIIKQQTGYITFPGTVTGEGGTVGELEHREKTKLRVHQHGETSINDPVNSSLICAMFMLMRLMVLL